MSGEDVSIVLCYLSGKEVRHTMVGEILVSELRKIAASDGAVRAFDSVHLIHKGRRLEDNELVAAAVTPGEPVLVAPTRKPPPRPQAPLDAPAAHSGSAAAADEDEDDDSDAALTRPQRNASELQKRIGRWLQQSAGAPDAVLACFYLVSIWAWLGFAVWLCVAPIAARFSLGGVYILTSMMLVMLCGLGKRKPGEASAYSIFNEGVRALPGEMTREQVDGAFRGRYT